jgi:Protein of unknown function (DUF2845)
MRTLARIVLASLLLGMSIAAPSARADAMRCGTKLVREGDTRSAVRSLCGEPADVQVRTILRRAFFDLDDDLHDNTFFFGNGLVEVPVEVWTYNFGPYKLMRRIRFIDGLIDEIETLGYGYHAREGSAAADSGTRDTYR